MPARTRTRRGRSTRARSCPSPRQATVAPSGENATQFTASSWPSRSMIGASSEDAPLRPGLERPGPRPRSARRAPGPTRTRPPRPSSASAPRPRGVVGGGVRRRGFALSGHRRGARRDVCRRRRNPRPSVLDESRYDPSRRPPIPSVDPARAPRVSRRRFRFVPRLTPRVAAPGWRKATVRTSRGEASPPPPGRRRGTASARRLGCAPRSRSSRPPLRRSAPR